MVASFDRSLLKERGFSKPWRTRPHHANDDLADDEPFVLERLGRSENDNAVPAAIRPSDATCLVTRGDDLLELASFGWTLIISPTTFPTSRPRQTSG